MIKIVNLNKIFYKNTNKEFYSLKDINLEIKKGSCTVLKGVSGSGKSTLLSIISTMQKPTSGEVYYKDELIFTYFNRFNCGNCHYSLCKHAIKFSVPLHMRAQPYRNIL